MSRARTKQIESGVEKEYESKGRTPAASRKIAGAVMGDIKREREAKKTTKKATYANPDENMIGKKCTIAEHRPCELDTGIAFAKDISAEAGVPITPQLKHIIETKNGSENQVRAALQEWRYSIPSTMREEADWLYDRVFPQHK